MPTKGGGYIFWSGTLAGVAIAAALLTSLAVVGIGLTNEELIIASNVAILFATNLVAMILGGFDIQVARDAGSD